MISGLHHVQLAMPKDGEDAARPFYMNVLGFREVEKPDALKPRGGVWFEKDAVRVHLGVEQPFSPARKAHPAFQVQSLDETLKHLDAHGVKFQIGEALPGIRRVYVSDPFGNRIELLEDTLTLE